MGEEASYKALEDDTSEPGDFIITEEKVGETFWAQLFRARSKTKESPATAKVIELAKVRQVDIEHIRDKTCFIVPFFMKAAHKNLTDIYDVFLVKEKKLIIMEEFLYLNLDALLKTEGAFSEKKAREHAAALGDAILFVHNAGVAHQNVSAANVFRNAQGVVKLSGLEYATICWDANNQEIRMHQCKRNLSPGRFIPPEVTSGNPYDPTKADCYSFGVIICFMLLGDYPYDAKREKSSEVQWNEAQDALDKSLQPAGKELVANCLKRDFQERWNMKEVLNHQWFKEGTAEATQEVTAEAT